MAQRSALATWSPEQIAQGREWVAAWKRAGPALDEVRRRELREMDIVAAIALLYGPEDTHPQPWPIRHSSGLVEQQRLFRRWRRT